MVGGEWVPVEEGVVCFYGEQGQFDVTCLSFFLHESSDCVLSCDVDAGLGEACADDDLDCCAVLVRMAR